jgi:hypothetical protein
LVLWLGIVFLGRKNSVGVELLKFFTEGVPLFLQSYFIGYGSKGIDGSLVFFLDLSIDALVVDVLEVGLFVGLPCLE